MVLNSLILAIFYNWYMLIPKKAHYHISGNALHNRKPTIIFPLIPIRCILYTTSGQNSYHAPCH